MLYLVLPLGTISSNTGSNLVMTCHPLKLRSCRCRVSG